MKALSDQHYQQYKNSESIAEQMIPMIGRLYREKDITTLVYSHSLVNQSAITILKNHRFVRFMESDSLSVRDTWPILQAVSDLNVKSIRVDIGKLATIAKEQNVADANLAGFVKEQLKDAIGANNEPKGPVDVVLYGFGRIGRILARLLVEKSGSGNGLRLRAIVIRGKKEDLAKRAGLLRRDSVHGSFDGTISVDEENNAIIANGNYIQIINASHPSEVDYTQYGIEKAVVVDNTGVWTTKEQLEEHLRPSVSRVILTAPSKGDGVENVVFGVNQAAIGDDKVVSAASCTTNAIVPVLKAMVDKYGLKSGHVETVHSYTNDQNLIDNYHKKERRGRAAALNMVITSTGAAKAAAKALPEVSGRLTGSAIRVPTPNVSMAILNLNLEKSVTREELIDYLRWTSLHSDLQRQIDFTTSTELVSTDVVGSRHAGLVDSSAILVNEEHKSCVIYVWYDNEFGYSCQVVRLLQHITGVEYPLYPAK